jgi:hypothetical protein
MNKDNVSYEERVRKEMRAGILRFQKQGRNQMSREEEKKVNFLLKIVKIRLYRI